MDKVFGSLKGLLKISAVVIDNSVFRLHYKFTVLVLAAFSILVTSKQYIGDPIDCISRDDIPSKLLDSFCWIHSTFSVESAWFKKVGEEVPYPGVDKYTPGEKRVYHAYYQWVCFVLFLEATLFYIPRYLWKMWEGGRIKALILGLDSPIMSTEDKNKKLEILVKYLYENLGRHPWYARKFFFCEILNLLNVIGNQLLLDAFLGNEFSTYGTKVLQFSEWDWTLRYDPMIRVFPRMTKCTFHRYGSSGDVQRHDAMCILPINIINEKIFIFLWFWFVILSVLSCFMLLFHGTMFLSGSARLFILRSKASLSRYDHLRVVLRQCGYSDWFMLELLCKNLDALNFKDLITDLAIKLEPKAIEADDFKGKGFGFNRNTVDSDV